MELTSEQVLNAIEAREYEIRHILEGWTTYEKFISYAKVHVDENLYKLSSVRYPNSITNSIIEAAKIGVFLDGKHASLSMPNLTDDNKNKYKTCKLTVTYTGLREIVRRNLPVLDIYSDVVYTNDKFNYRLGDSPKIEHYPELRKPRGAMYACYAIAVMKNGAVLREVMTAAEVEKAKQTADTSKYSGWTNHPAQMWKKTVTKRLLNRMMVESDKTAAVEKHLSENENINLPNNSDGRLMVKKPKVEIVEKNTKPKKSVEKQVIREAESAHNRAKSDFHEGNTSDTTDELPGESELPDDDQGEKTYLTATMKKVFSENDRNHLSAEVFASAVYLKANQKQTTYAKAYKQILMGYSIQELSELAATEIEKIKLESEKRLK